MFKDPVFVTSRSITCRSSDSGAGQKVYWYISLRPQTVAIIGITYFEFLINRYSTF